MARLILGIYNILGNIFIWPLCLCLYRHSNFKDTLMQRLAFKIPAVPHGELIWLHASSLGEVRAITPMIAALKSKRPDCRICLSSMTATGRQAASGIKGIDLILPMPFDLAWVMRCYFTYLKPKILVIVETEIWPNLLIQAQKAHVETMFINARISLKAFNRYKMIRPLMAHILNNARILASATENASRFTALGAGQVEVFGNIKFDTMRKANPANLLNLKQALKCGDRPVFIAGSTRKGEERLVIEAIREARLHIPELFCIIAPRHPENIPILIELAESFGISWALRSKINANTDLIFIDSVGELFDLYGVAHVAFVGGSLLDEGGQNILEPIVQNIPTIHGPHMENFLWALDIVKGHTIVVRTAAELGRAIVEVLTEPERYNTMSRLARESLLQEQGINMRYVSAILDLQKMSKKIS
jgi:3-deoxy-D-manno-octulosonic-acid transferase